MASRKIEVEIIGDASSLERAFGQGKKSASGFERGMNKASIGAASALAALGLAAKIGFDEFSQGEAAAAQTAAVLKSTGGIANVTAGQVDALATALLHKSGVDDETIKSGENMLLTFTNVRNEVGKGNDVFNQATAATLDLSVAMGKDMSDSAILVGKALNDPIAGLGALHRVGVQFTEGQKDSIKAMVDAGNTMGAQKVILSELTTEFGGSAKAAGDTFAGKVNKAKEEAKNFGAELVTGAMPALNKLADGLSGATELMEKHQTTTKIVIGVVALFATGILALRAAMAVYTIGAELATAAQWLFNVAVTANPIALIIAALVLLGVGLVVAYRHSETFRDIVNGAFNAVKVAAVFVITQVLGLLDKFLGGIQAIAEAASHLPFVGDMFAGVADAVGRARENVRGLSDAINGLHDKTVTITTISRNSLANPPPAGTYSTPARRAAGGPVAAGTPYLVGERGPELFMPGYSGQIVPVGGGRGGASVTNIFSFPNYVGDKNELMDMIKSELIRDGKRNGGSALGGFA